MRAMAEKQSYGVDVAAKYRPENARDADRQEDTDGPPRNTGPTETSAKSHSLPGSTETMDP